MTEKEKAEKVVEYVRAFDAIEQEMEPYKESKRDLRNSYKENGWLTGEEMRSAIRAYRMLKKDEDLETLQAMYEKLEGVYKRVES